jgi:hypothetical protein
MLRIGHTGRSGSSQCVLYYSTNPKQYYVSQGDIVPGAEDLRTPMSDSLDLERAVRGQITGFLSPTSFWICRQKGQTINTRGGELRSSYRVVEAHSTETEGRTRDDAILESFVVFVSGGKSRCLSPLWEAVIY